MKKLFSDFEMSKEATLISDESELAAEIAGAYTAEQNRNCYHEHTYRAH